MTATCGAPCPLNPQQYACLLIPGHDGPHKDGVHRYDDPTPSPTAEGREGGEVEALIAHTLLCTRCRMGWYCGGVSDEDYEHAEAIAPLVERLVTEAQAEAWDEGYEAAEHMARCWGHTDNWEDEPTNPYRELAAGVRGEEGAG